MWGMDLMGKFLKARNGFEYLVVAVDYFSKWNEAKPLVHPTEENVLNFFHDPVLCRFGVLCAVVRPWNPILEEIHRRMRKVTYTTLEILRSTSTR